MPRQKSKFINVEEPRILKSQLLISRVSYSRCIEKYFQRGVFYVEYDRDIQDISDSILQIPVLSNIITVAWAVGADIFVKELDKSYLESLNKIGSVMKAWYPKLSFSTSIHVGNVVSNNFSNRGYGSLFSGGVDSTATHIRHRKRKPSLIMIRGADIPLSEEEFWRKVRSKYEDFAEEAHLQISFIETSLHEFLNEGCLDTEFGPHLTGSWWGGFHHGIGMLGLCPPLTAVKDIGTLLIASSLVVGEFKYPWGSHPLVDNKLSWADVKVVHDGHQLGRQEKIRNMLKDYVITEKRYPLIRSCYSQFRDFNCSKCEKCCRTVTGLVLENIDPNRCGFSVGRGFFDYVRANLVKDRGGFIQSHAEEYMWSDIQRHIPKRINHDLCNSREFFEWFRKFDIPEMRTNRKMDAKWCLFFIYYRLPNNVRKAIAKLKPIAKLVISL